MIGIFVSFPFQFLLPFLLLDVGLDVEVGEENKKHGSVEQNHVAKYFWKITLDEERKAGVNEEGHKLTHLQLCQISETTEFTNLYLKRRDHVNICFSWYYLTISKSSHAILS